MSRSPQENADKYAAKQLIRSADYLAYLNPIMGVELSIPRPMIETVVSQGIDWMDACQMIAHAARPALSRLSTMRFGQIEILNLPAPLPEDLYVLIWTQAGQDKFFVGSQPFFPYR